MGNIQTCEDQQDENDILNGSGFEENTNVNKYYKISALLDYISNDNNFDFNINIKCLENKNKIDTENVIRKSKNNLNINFNLFRQSNIENNLNIFNNDDRINQKFNKTEENIYINFLSLGTSFTPKFNYTSYCKRELKRRRTTIDKNTAQCCSNFISKNNDIINKLNSNYSNISTISDEEIENNKNIIQTFSMLKSEQEKILNGNIIKIGFIGRQSNNQKVLKTFFINEKNPTKTDIYCVDKKLIQYQKDFCLKYKPKLYNKQVSNSYCFFANTDYVDFCCNYFASFHKTESFSKECDFKNDLFSENYENCIELNLNDLSNFIDFLCHYDIIIYCIDKMNENINAESKYLDYLIKRFPIFRYLIEKQRFFIVLNKISCEVNNIYQYQNEDANVTLNKLNQKFNNKLIFEMDLNKTYEEKIIYFYKILREKNRKKLFEKNFPIFNSNLKNHFSNASSKEIYNDSNDQNQKYNYENFILNKIYFENGKSINKKFSKFDYNQNFYIISDMFEKILMKKFIFKNSNYFTISNSDNLKYKNFYEFYEQFMKDKNYHSFDFNKAIEFDKIIYDSIYDILILKFENFYQEFKYEKLFNDIEKKKL